MNLTEILSNLCYHDPRNPDYTDDDEDDKPENCYCDNCFYGRDKLAKEILKNNKKETK